MVYCKTLDEFKLIQVNFLTSSVKIEDGHRVEGWNKTLLRIKIMPRNHFTTFLVISNFRSIY